VLERGEAIGLLVILAVMLVATVYVAVRRTPSFGFVIAPVEVALAAWVVHDMDGPDGDRPDAGGSGPRPRGDPSGPRSGGGPQMREPRRPRPGAGSGSAARRR
jgi:hypothetical protein